MDAPLVKPTEEEWLRHKNAIHSLYFVQEKPLKEVLAAVRAHGLRVTVAQLEYKLKQWKIQRNIDKATWVAVGYKIAKRERHQKGTGVLYHGKVVKKSRVEKETARHRRNIYLRSPATRSPSPSPFIGDNTMIYSPQPLPMSFEWPQNLPWLESHRLIAPILEKLQAQATFGSNHSSLISSLRSAYCCSLDRDISLWSVSSSLVSILPQLGARIGIAMPESWPGQNIHRARLLIAGTESDVLTEHLQQLIFEISNGLLELNNATNWLTTVEVLRASGLMGIKLDLSNSTNQSIVAAMARLLGATIIRICARGHSGCEAIKERDASDVAKWLLSCGADANQPIRPFSGLTFRGCHVFEACPLFAAIRTSEVELTRQLLEAGADPNYEKHNPKVPIGRKATTPTRSHCLENALRYARRNCAVFICRLLLKHGARTGLDSAMIRAVEIGEWKLAIELLEHGADLGAPPTLKSNIDADGLTGVLYDVSFLSGAARSGEKMTLLALRLLESRLLQPLESFVTADVLVAAAAKGQNNVISLLYGLNPSALCCNKYGVSALHAAAWKGHLDTCQLLLSLDPQSLTDLVANSTPSPLQLACFKGHDKIVIVFLKNGADAHATSPPFSRSSTSILPFSKMASDETDLFKKPFTPEITPLFLAFFALHIDLCTGDEYDGEKFYIDIVTRRASTAKLLLRSGATLSERHEGYELLVATHAGDAALVSEIMMSGANPNPRWDQWMTGPDLTLLQRAMGTFKWGFQTTAAILKVLLKHGTKPTPTDVIKAILFGHQGIVRSLLTHNEAINDSALFQRRALECAVLSKNYFVVSEVQKLLPRKYCGGALCATVITDRQVTFSKFLSYREPHTQVGILEGTALGLAARFGHYCMLDDLLRTFPEAHRGFAVLPFDPYEPLNAWGTFQDTFRTFWRVGYYRRLKGSPLSWAALNYDKWPMNLLLQHGFEPDLLTWITCAARRDVEALRLLQATNKRVDYGSHNVSMCLEGPLTIACRQLSTAMVTILLEVGARVNEEYQTRKQGRSPLQSAVYGGNLDIVHRLLNEGADVNEPPAKTRGATALQIAASNGHTGLAKLLLERGASVNAAGAEIHGRTALEVAAEWGRLDMVGLLLHHGDFTTDTGRGQYVSAVRRATQQGHRDVTSFLKSAQPWVWDNEDGTWEEESCESEVESMYRDPIMGDLDSASELSDHSCDKELRDYYLSDENYSDNDAGDDGNDYSDGDDDDDGSENAVYDDDMDDDDMSDDDMDDDDMYEADDENMEEMNDEINENSMHEGGTTDSRQELQLTSLGSEEELKYSVSDEALMNYEPFAELINCDHF